MCLYSSHIPNTKEKKNIEGEEVVIHFDNGVTKRASRMREIGLDGQVFMEDLFSKVQERGAQLQYRHFDSLEDLLRLEEPIIINCTSMGSAYLFNDQEFIPVRGHIVYFKPQEGTDGFFENTLPIPGTLNRFFVMIYPWEDRLILGGVYEYGLDDPLMNAQIVDTIIENGERYLSENS